MKITKNYCCQRCGDLIHKSTALYGDGYCKKCFQLGSRNPNYIDGRTTKKYFCMKCGTETSYQNNICRKCCIILRKNNSQTLCVDCGKVLRGANTLRCLDCYRQIHKSKVKDKFCIDCGMKIYKYANSLRCKPCENINRKGENSHRFGKTVLIKFCSYKNIWFKSSWEANFAKWCDGSGIKWQYESKTFNLGNTTYTPDFYLPEFDTFIEIKGYWRDDAKKKFIFTQKYFNENLICFDEKILKMLGIV